MRRDAQRDRAGVARTSYTLARARGLRWSTRRAGQRFESRLEDRSSFESRFEAARDLALGRTSSPRDERPRTPDADLDRTDVRVERERRSATRVAHGRSAVLRRRARAERDTRSSRRPMGRKRQSARTAHPRWRDELADQDCCDWRARAECLRPADYTRALGGTRTRTCETANALLHVLVRRMWVVRDVFGVRRVTVVGVRVTAGVTGGITGGRMRPVAVVSVPFVCDPNGPGGGLQPRRWTMVDEHQVQRNDELLEPEAQARRERDHLVEPSFGSVAHGSSRRRDATAAPSPSQRDAAARAGVQDPGSSHRAQSPTA